VEFERRVERFVETDEYETVYNNVPPTGLGAAQGSDLVPADGERETAAGRLGQDGDEEQVVADGGR
jgi:hypothetical protein